MTREEIPFAHGFAGKCSMCNITIAADESRVAVYDEKEGKRMYIGMYCPTCAEIGRKEKVAEGAGKEIISDMELILRIYDLGNKYAEKHKIKVQPDDMMKAAISVFIAADRRGY